MLSALFPILGREVGRVAHLDLNHIFHNLLLDQLHVLRLQVLNYLVVKILGARFGSFIIPPIDRLGVPKLVFGLRDVVDTQSIYFVAELVSTLIGREVVLHGRVRATPSQYFRHRRIDVPQVLLLTIKPLVVGLDLFARTQNLVVCFKFARAWLARVRNDPALNAGRTEQVLDLGSVSAPLLQAATHRVGLAAWEVHQLLLLFLQLHFFQFLIV